MITEDYCSYEVAKLLKEKGFDELSRFYYFEPRQSPEMFPSQREHRNTDKVYGENTLIAPTHQMAMKWLREIYNIYINIQPDFPSDKDYKMYWCWSTNILHENCISMTGYQCYIETYEKAVEAAIKYVLENFI